MSDIALTAEARTEFGKGAARKARREGQIPAVLYSHGNDPIHVLLPVRETTLAIRQANALFEITLGKDKHLAIVKDVQRDVVRTWIEHIDLLIVKKGEKVAVDLPVHITGEVIGGNVYIQDLASLHISAEATHLPESIEVSVDGLSEGAKIVAGDITLPKGVELLTDPDALVVQVAASRAGVAAGVEGDAAEEAAAE